MVRVVASARLPVPPARASQLILNPAIMEKWLIGAHSLRADAGWPFFDTSLSWQLTKGGELCEARVIENTLPSALKVSVTTPTHSRVVTHKFTANEDGGTTYERIVDAELFGLRKLFGAGQLRHLIEAEVQRAASILAEEVARLKKP